MFCFERPGRPTELQWELAIGIAIAIAFKLLLRYDCLCRCCWDDGFCDVRSTHVTFFLDKRKNHQARGNRLTVATGRSKALTTSASWANDCFRKAMSYSRSTNEAALTTGDLWSTSPSFTTSPNAYRHRNTRNSSTEVRRPANEVRRSNFSSGAWPFAGRDLPAGRHFGY